MKTTPANQPTAHSFVKLRRIYRFTLALTLGVLYNFSTGAQVPAQQCVSTAVVGGTADALTIPMLPCAYTTTLLIATAAFANTTTTPTMKMGNMPPLPIVNATGGELKVGDIAGPGFRMILTTDGQRWYLLNSLVSGATPAVVWDGGGVWDGGWVWQ